MKTKAKNLDLISTNSESTLDRTINNTYQLYTFHQSENIFIDYGDKSGLKTIYLESGIFDY